MRKADWPEDVLAAFQGVGRWAGPATELSLGIEALGLAISETAQAHIRAYLGLLAHWNRAYNLTRITDPRAMVCRHALDSLAIAPWVPQGRVLDLGAGAGLPGLILALAGWGESHLLVDSNGKKVRFMRHAIRTFGLTQVEAVHERIEALQLATCPDVVVARALAPLGQLVDWTHPWLDQGAVLLAMKAELKETEMADVPSSYNVRIKALTWPGLKAQRHLVLVGQQRAIDALETSK